MESKHTTGEWATNSNRELTWITTNDESESKVICTMSNNDKCGANAKLIAAAPELLEACLFLESAIIDGVKGLFPEEIEKLKSAIKKATE